MAASPLRMIDGYQRACWLAALAAFSAGSAEFAYGRFCQSEYLTSDAISWAYSCAIYSLAALSYRSTWRNKAALGLAAIFLLQGSQSAYEFAKDLHVQSETATREIAIGSFGALALAAMIAAMLFAYRNSGDAEHQATWLAARNDVVTGVFDIAVVCLAKLVLISDWPETVADAVGSALMLWAGARVAITALRTIHGDAQESRSDAHPLHA
jgi:hypothetical protein